MTVKSFFDLHKGVTFKEDKWYLLPTKRGESEELLRTHHTYLQDMGEGG